MIVQVDRLMKELLEFYVDFLKTDSPESDTEWEEILGLDMPGGYPESKIVAERNSFREHPPSVGLSFARTNGPFPFWSVILSDSPVETEFVGKVGEITSEPVDGIDSQVELNCLVENQGVSFIVYARNNPDVTSMHSAIIKAMLLRYKRDILSLGISGYFLNSTADVEPAIEYGPMMVFQRSQSWGFTILQSMTNVTPFQIIRAPFYLALKDVPIDEGIVGQVDVVEES